MKKSLLLMLFLALTWSWTAKAEEQLTVNDGTTTNSYVPIYGLFVDTKNTTSEFIIPAETDGMSDMIGGTISKLTFYVSNPPASWGSPTIQLYIGEVDGTTISSINGPSNFTVVSTSVWDNTKSTIELAFDNPYVYEGGNLLIGATVQTKSSTYKGTSFLGISAPSGAARYNTGSGSGTAQSFLPKVTFEYTPGSGAVCDKPSSLEVSGITANGATLTWTDGSGSYNVEYKKASDSDWTPLLASTSDLTADLTELMPNTPYQARVQSVCGSDVSGWKSASFVTPCAAYDIPYEYGFEDATPFSCWTPISGTEERINNSYTAHQGSYYLKFSGTTSNMIALPEFSDATNTLRLEFWARPENSSEPSTYTNYSGKFAVGYLTDISDANTFVAIETYNCTEWASTPAYEKKVVDFNNAPANAIIALRQFDCATNYYWYVDDVTVKEIPSCLEPTGLAVSSDDDAIGPNSIKLQFTAGESNESAWKLQYKKSADSEWTTITDAITENPYELPGLLASTLYDIRIAAWCDPSNPDGISGYTEPIQVATACEAVTVFPIPYGFETSEGFPSNASTPTTNQLGACWRNEATLQNGSNSTRVWGTSTSYKHEGSQALILPDKGNSTNFAKTMLVFPEMLFTSERGYTVSFWIYRNGTNTNPEGFKVYISDTDTISPNAVELGHYSRNYGIAYPVIESASGWYQYEIAIPKSTMTGNVFLIFEGQSYYGSGTYVDDILIEPTPTCKKPSALMLEKPSSRTAHTATLKWTAGDENQDAWLIAVDTIAAFNPDTVPAVKLIPADNDTFIVDGLLANKQYYAYVRANCGNDDFSAWSAAKASFKTLEGNKTPTDLAVESSSLTSSSATIGWSGVATNDLHQSFDLYWALATVTEVPEEPEASNLISGITASSYALSGLNEETEYKVWVRDNCGSDGFSDWTSSISFTTLANCAVPFNVAVSEETAIGATIAWNGNSGSYDVQYRTAEKLIDVVVTTESFTDETPASYDATSYELPKDWYSYNSSSSGNAPRVSNSNKYSYISLTGNYLLLTTNATNQSAYAVMPKYNNIEGAQFTYKYESTSYGTFSVGYVTDYSGYDTYTVLKTPQKTTSATIFELSAEDIAAINSANGYIAFCYESGSGTYYSVGIDEITITTGTLVPAGAWQTVSSDETEKQITGLASETKYDVQVLGVCGATTTEPSEIVSFTTLPSCLPVSGLEVNNITASSADFSWADNSEQTQWQYACVDAGVTPENWTLVINAASVNVSGLTANTPYDFYVRAYCGVDDYSEAIKLNFRTECEVAVLPFVESFDSLKVANSIPDCWDNSEGTTTSDDYKWSFNTSTSGNGAAKGTGVDGGNCVRFDSYSNYEDNTNLLATPIINLSEDAVLTFWWKNPTGGAGEVLISVDGDDKVSLLSEGLTSISSWTFKNINLSTYTGHNVQIFFKGTSNWGYDDAYLYLDNVCVAPIETIAIGESLYATYYNEDNGYIMPENLTGHVFSTENTPKMLVQEYEAGDIVPAATPLVLEATAAGNYSLVPTIGGVDPDASNQLVGVNEAGIIGSATDGYVYYVLSMNASNEPESVGFYYMLDEGKGGFSMPAHKAYLKYTASSAPARFYLFNGENGATWLDNLQGVEGTVKFMHEGNIYILRDSIIYDATGRKVRELK